MTEVQSPSIESAHDAIGRFAWDRAAEILRALDERHELSGDDLERLGEVEWWLGNLNACIDARERAYELHSKAGNRRGAARAALALANDYTSKLAGSRAQGWHRRAIRLLQDQPECVERGYMLLEQVWTRFRRDAPDESRRLAEEAVEIGRRHGDRDLEMRALAELGRVLVNTGEPEDGLAYVEEASAAALGGELGPLATSIVFCMAIGTSRELTDLGRAGEWADAAKRWCERQAIKGFPGVCRVYRAEVMRLRGAWSDAELEVRQACGELQPFAPKLAGPAFRELGEIRLRMGDLTGAEEAFRHARQLANSGQPGLARLQVVQGNPGLAVRGLLEKIEDENWSRLDTARLLPTLVEAAIASGDHERAAWAARELGVTSTQYGTPLLQAESSLAHGRVELAMGRAADAARTLRRAVKLYEEVELPYEAAESRIALARAYLAGDDRDAAVLELSTALTSFEVLGAVRAAAEAAADLRWLAPNASDEIGAPVTGIGRPAAGRMRGQPTTATRTFMFTDIVASTALIEAIGDEAWHDLVCWHDDTLRALFPNHGGEVLDQTGDGFFVAFASEGSAVECAVAIQRTLARHRQEHGFAPPVRIGLHTAEVRKGRGGYRGKGIHVAARIAATAGGGEILASEATVSAAGGKHRTAEPRPVLLRGIADAVAIAAVHWR